MSNIQDYLTENLIIQIDTREKSIDTILNVFRKKDINHKFEALKTGDYTAYLKDLDFSFENIITIERKANLEELSQNLTKGRERFERELQRAKDNNTKFILLIEDMNAYENILTHKYDTKFNPSAYLGSLFTYKARFGIEVVFIDPQLTPSFMYRLLRAEVTEWLRNQNATT
jgi:hypothetical protein